ncbi:hypothetical protein C0Q70_09814 [Pomacea canaliculata]|uniref:SOCS box domain-containing protein n=1 Tax=Pomacea canaliculata TaxID=400727 RepID=A0A2T7PAV7_POMCA|nr:hypothetical protein C0Q70_09814 [Pomacea canaliculata]
MMAYAAQKRKSREHAEMQIKMEEDLINAVKENNITEVEKLLKAGTSPDAAELNRKLYYESKNYLTPLHHAAGIGAADILALLIRFKANVNAKDRFDVTPLHEAAKNGFVSCVRILLEAGADINAPTKYSKTFTGMPYLGGTTPLHLAAEKNRIPCAIELILYGADYNAVDEEGNTSLYIAARNGSSGCVMGHLENAVRMDILSIPNFVTESTALHECVRHGMKECIRELIRRGSDVSHKALNGRSPLHEALSPCICSFDFDVIKDMVLNGYNCDINQKDVCDVATFFIALGANPNIRSRCGEDLIQHELRQNNPISDVLEAIIDVTPNLLPVNNRMAFCLPGACSNGAVSRLVEHYNSIASQPRSLQHLARCAVRRAMGPKRIRKVPYLPLPKIIRDYLLLNNRLITIPHTS